MLKVRPPVAAAALAGIAACPAATWDRALAALVCCTRMSHAPPAACAALTRMSRGPDALKACLPGHARVALARPAMQCMKGQHPLAAQRLKKRASSSAGDCAVTKGSTTFPCIRSLPRMRTHLAIKYAAQGTGSRHGRARLRQHPAQTATAGPPSAAHARR